MRLILAGKTCEEPTPGKLRIDKIGLHEGYTTSGKQKAQSH